MTRPRTVSTRRRFLGAVVGGAGLLGLAACGAPAAAPSPAATAAPTSPPRAPASTPAAPSPVAAPAKVGTAPPKAVDSNAEVDALVAGAKREGALTYYSANPIEMSQKFIKAFRERYGLEFEVDIVRLASSPLGQRYASEAETDNVVADVLLIADDLFMDDALAKGWFAKVDDLPAAANWSQPYWNGTYGLVSITPQEISWNTNLVKDNEAPKTWEALLDPRWQGQILFADPRSAASLIAWAQLMRETFGDDYLRRLAQQQPRIVQSTVPGSQQLAAGSAMVLAPNTRSSVLPLIQQGAPLGHVIPELTTGIQNTAAVSARAPHPFGARLLLNFLLTREGQEALNGDYAVSVLPNIPGTDPLPAKYQLPKTKEALAKRDEILGLLGIQ